MMPYTDGKRRHRLARVTFYAHLWLGVIFTVALTVISITGIVLNHKRALGLMPDVQHEPAHAFANALPLARLAEIGLAAAGKSASTNTSARLQPSAGALDRIDRMDVRPRDGYVKVRLRDAASTEVTIDVASGEVLHVGERGDVFLERLHSGEAFGDGWVLLSDAAAIVLLLTLVTGYWLWLAPRIRHSAATRSSPGDKA
ncbi:MAG: PepSY-associated TM helix domain-containing protein [Gemmatimonadaceae bacterium]